MRITPAQLSNRLTPKKLRTAYSDEQPYFTGQERIQGGQLHMQRIYDETVLLFTIKRGCNEAVQWEHTSDTTFKYRTMDTTSNESYSVPTPLRASPWALTIFTSFQMHTAIEHPIITHLRHCLEYLCQLRGPGGVSI